MNDNLTDIEFQQVSEVIASLMGLHFPVDRRTILGHNLTLAASGLNFQNRTGLIDWLLSTALNKSQIETLAPYFTIAETYFWREQGVFAAFTQTTLAELVASRTGKTKRLTIWCAACSTGEEAYSIAIALRRTIPDIKDWKITILATDINKNALSKAESGIYGSWSFRNAPGWLKSGYFRELDERRYEIIPEIRKMVTFSSLNLTRDNYDYFLRKQNKPDIIFCRNVLMYFTKEWAAKVSRNLYQSLSENGWLVVSSCELSSNLFPLLTKVYFPGAVLYRKGEGEFSGRIPESGESYGQLLTNPSPACTVEISTPYELETETPDRSETFLEEVSEPQPGFNAPEPEKIENKNSIRSLADQGYLEQALANCNEAIASDKLSAGLYFLRASILQEMDKSHDAIRSLKQAIYIDPDYVMGHFALGNIFIRQGFNDSARRYFNNALQLLSTLSNEEVTEEFEGFSARHIRELIISSLQAQRQL